MTAAEILLATGTLVVSLVGALGGSAFLLRRANQKLIETQADREEAETDKIRDDLARSWIVELRKEQEDLRKRLSQVDDERRKEQRLRRIAIALAVQLMHWIEDNTEPPRPGLPPVPEELREYV